MSRESNARERLRFSTYGAMRVIGADRGSGRLYRCACGWVGWSSWGHARKHAADCPQSIREPATEGAE